MKTCSTALNTCTESRSLLQPESTETLSFLRDGTCAQEDTSPPFVHLRVVDDSSLPGNMCQNVTICC